MNKDLKKKNKYWSKVFLFVKYVIFIALVSRLSMEIFLDPICTDVFCYTFGAGWFVWLLSPGLFIAELFDVSIGVFKSMSCIASDIECVTSNDISLWWDYIIPTINGVFYGAIVLGLGGLIRKFRR